MAVPGTGQAAPDPWWVGPTAAADDHDGRRTGRAPLRRTGSAQGATSLGLFVDLVYVFALTRIS
ncbi:hypothetical protein ACN268_11755 [Micromonospora sp. WMMD735]|uniref:hypothetical protein n=1 Tax=Micromonospora sp. WMMD735 TaxID=3404130 RepID=UPI003B9481E9